MADNPKFNNFTVLGTSGLNRFGGAISEEWLPALSGSAGQKVYQEMADNCSIVGAILFAIKMLCRQVTWYTETNQADPEEAAFLQDCMDNMEIPWSHVVSEALTMLPFGWALQEICYKKRDDGRIGWQGFPLRAQTSLYEWKFDETTGNLQGMVQQAPPDYQIRFIPMEKALLYRTESNKDNPEGRSILRNAYRSWFFLKNIEEFEAIGVERDLVGYPVARVPIRILSPNATAAEKTTLEAIKTLVTNIRRDQAEGVVFPIEYDQNGNSLWSLELLSQANAGTRQFDIDKIIQRKNVEIAQTSLADFILLGHEKVGSFALASSKTSLFSVAIGAFLDEIQSVVNQYAVSRLMELNGIQPPWPKIVHSDIETVDLIEFSTAIANLAKAGMPLFGQGEGEIEKRILDILGLPEPSEGET